MAGLTATGFDKKKLSDIVVDFENTLIDLLGPINTDPDSVFGQLIGVFSEAIGDLWDTAEDTYFAMYLLSAEGIHLDNAVALIGGSRLAATKSNVLVAFSDPLSTLIPAGTQVRQSSTGELFESLVTVTIDNTNALITQVSINTIPTTIDITYTLTINGTAYSTIESVGATKNSILDNLLNALPSIVTGIHDTDAETLTITTAVEETAYSLTVSTEVDIDQIWSPIRMYSLTVGAKSIPAETIDVVETPVTGASECLNLSAGDIGRNIESDTELRVRVAAGLRVGGAASIPAIESRILQEVDGVTSCIVKENDTESVDGDGRPPHSIEVIVSGGDDQDIVDKIWELRSGGIQTYGNSSATITDSEGLIKTIYFSRPIDQYVHIELTITLNPEETFPDEGVTAIKEAIVAFGNALGSGADLIVQRFFTPIYSVPGVLNITVYQHDITLTAGGTPTYTTNNISIAATEIAIFSVDRIAVTIA